MKTKSICVALFLSMIFNLELAYASMQKEVVADTGYKALAPANSTYFPDTQISALKDNKIYNISSTGAIQLVANANISNKVLKELISYEDYFLFAYTGDFPRGVGKVYPNGSPSVLVSGNFDGIGSLIKAPMTYGGYGNDLFLTEYGNSNVILADDGATVGIVRITTNGDKSQFYDGKNAAIKLYRAMDLAFSPQTFGSYGNRIFVIDSNIQYPNIDNHRILAIASDKTAEEFIDLKSIGYTTDFISIDFHPTTGELFVADSHNIYRIDASKNVYLFDSGYSGITDIRFNSEGALFVSDWDALRTYKIYNGSPIASKKIADSTPQTAPASSTNTENSIGNLCTKGAGSPGPFLVNNGDYFHQHTDLRIPALGPPLVVTRYYNSIDLYSGPFGHGWNMDYTSRLVEMEAEGGTIYTTVQMGNGVRRKFKRETDGSFTSPIGQDDTLVENGDGSFTFNGQCSTCSTKPRKAYQFNADGALTAITDTDGNMVTIAYNSDGRIAAATDANSRSINFTYGTNGRISEITDFSGRSWTYGYDASGNLTSVTDPLGNIIEYQYNSDHNMTAVIDAKGQTMTVMTYDDGDKLQSFTDNGGAYTIDYDPVNLVTQKTNPASGLFSFSYDANGNITNKTGPHGRNLDITWDANVDVSSKVNGRNVETAYTWDDQHNMTSITQDATDLNLTTSYAYDPTTGKVSQITNPLGNITSMIYDANGNLLERQAPIGTTLFIYDSFGNLVQTEDPDGHLTAREYNANGYLTRVYIPDTSPLIETTFTYDQRGNLLGRTDPNGNTTSYTYDLLDQLLSTTDAAGNSTSFEYDANGNLTRIVDPAGTHTDLVYDVQDRLVTRTNAANIIELAASTSYTYDSRGNLLTITNALGHITNYTYDTLSRVTQVENHLGHAWQFTYDESGNLRNKTDPNGNTTSFGYDALNRLTTVTDAEGNTTSYSYDGNNNLLTITDANSATATSHDYDANNRLVAASDGLNHETTSTYTAAGRLLSRTSPIGEVTSYAYEALTGRLASITYDDGRQEVFAYDAAGNLISVNDTQTGASVSYTYDALNRVASENQLHQTLTYNYDASGNRDTLNLPGGGTYDYDFDKLNRLIAVADPQGETTHFTYDASGRRTGLNYGNGAYSAYSYDAANRLTSVAHHRADDTSIASYAYTYDNMNNRLSVTDHNGDVINYAYDNTYKLLSAVYPDQTVGFTYDPVGNRLTKNDAAGSVSYSYDAANRLTAQSNPDGSSVSYSYDDNGRIQTKTITAADLSTDTFTYLYDVKDRLIKVNSTEGVNNQYEYDPMNRRVRAVTSAGIRRFIYDGRNPLADITGDDATPVYSLHYTPALGLDILASFSESGQSRYYLRDGLNSVRQILAADETVLAAYDYQPYGSVKSHTGSSASDFAFTGRRVEDDSGLMYYRSRYYDPGVGRFLKKDSYSGSLEEPLSLHRYGYVHGNPVNYVDPTGRLLDNFYFSADMGVGLGFLEYEFSGSGSQFYHGGEKLSYSQTQSHEYTGGAAGVNGGLTYFNQHFDKQESIEVTAVNLWFMSFDFYRQGNNLVGMSSRASAGVGISYSRYTMERDDVCNGSAADHYAAGNQGTWVPEMAAPPKIDLIENN